jgi:hypothetical protein
MVPARSAPAAAPKGAAAAARTALDTAVGHHHSAISVTTVGSADQRRMVRHLVNERTADPRRLHANRMPVAADRYSPVQRPQTGSWAPAT